MKRWGYMFAAIALILGLAAVLFRSVEADVPALISMLGFMIFMWGIGLIFCIHGAGRLMRGEVKLRPWHALRQVPLLFAAFLGFKFLASFTFSEREQNWLMASLSSLVLATLFAFYFTAYRRTT